MQCWLNAYVNLYNGVARDLDMTLTVDSEEGLSISLGGIQLHGRA